MDDVRWFAPNRYCTLIVPRLRDRGLSIALDGDGPARLAIAMDAQVAAAAYSFAARHRSVLIHYVWDLPPWRLGRGRTDWVFPAVRCPFASIQNGSHQPPRLEDADCSPCHISRRTRTMRRSFERLLVSSRRQPCASLGGVRSEPPWNASRPPWA